MAFPTKQQILDSSQQQVRDRLPTPRSSTCQREQSSIVGDANGKLGIQW